LMPFPGRREKCAKMTRATASDQGHLSDSLNDPLEFLVILVRYLLQNVIRIAESNVQCILSLCQGHVRPVDRKWTDNRAASASIAAQFDWSL
jgi:hypothetical protein